MATVENKNICRRFFDEVVSQGDLSVVDEICAPEYRLHATLSGPEAIDREALKELVASWRSSFPDGTITVEDLVAEGDLVAARMLERGTHLGGFKGISPTGRLVAYGSMTFLRVVDGRITDHWGLLDMPSLLEQIGSQAHMKDEHPNIPLVRQALEAFSGGDMAEVKAYLAEDIVWHVPGRGRLAGDKKGLDEVIRFFGEAGGPPETTKFSFDAREVMASDDFVSMFVHYHHVRVEEVFDQDGVELFRLDGGKIKEFWAFITDSRAFDDFFR
jgi:predicted ester cyclase/ketosteroid isomerase-like protein